MSKIPPHHRPHFTPQSAPESAWLAWRLENALWRADWLALYDLFQKGPVAPERRDPVLLASLQGLGEEMAVRFVQAARNQAPFLKDTDADILAFAAERGWIDLAAEQLQCGVIKSWAANQALEMAAAKNNRPLVGLLLNSSLCTQNEKNGAAVTAARQGSLDSMLEFLSQKAISGDYFHSASYEPCIWSLLIRVASQHGHGDIAEAVAILKPTGLTPEDLGFLTPRLMRG